MHRHRILASATLAVAVIASLQGATLARAQNDPGSRAIRFLQAQQHTDGSIDGTAGETEDTVMGAAALGYDPGTLRASSGKTVLDYLATVATAQAATTSAGPVAKLALAVAAAGHSPTSFAGANLISLLATTYHPATGAYGDGATFTQSLAILAQRSAAVTPPAKAITYLVSLENTDGSWNFSAAAGLQGDTNSTSVAVMALAAGGDHSHDAKVLTFLAGQQNSDGGFPYQSPSPFGTASDPDSDALVLAALRAVGAHPERSGWTKNGHTPLDNLLSMQDSASGGFIFPGNTGADAFTTSEVPAGLALQPLPVAFPGVATGGLSAQGAAAVSALKYLARSQHADGSIDGTAGETEDTILGTAAAGYDPATLVAASGASAYDFLAAVAAASAATAHANPHAVDAGKVAKLMLAIQAGGRNPASFAGHDLVAVLNGSYAPATGDYGDGATFTQSLAILALHSTTAAIPGIARSHLVSLQNVDGSWNFGSAAGPQGDTNSTSIALMALAALGDHSHDASALSYLHGQQNNDGGFPYQSPSPFGTASDPDSDALVLEAMIATFQSPGAASWTQGGHTVTANLLSLQDSANGGFIFPGNPGADAFTTSEVPAGLERVPLGAVARFTPGLALLPAAPAPPPPPPPPAPVRAPNTGGGPAVAVEPVAASGSSVAGAGTAGTLAALVALAVVLGARRKRRRQHS
jgi:prenyltransferase beta subunit